MRIRTTAGQSGFTLAELLAAMSIITIALVALAAALQHGLTGIETGRGESVAVFLVEDKLEELRALALVDWGNAALQPGTTTEYCRPSSACSPTSAPDGFRRSTTVAAGNDGTCTARCKLVTVSVFYRPVTPLGQLDRERRVDVAAMFVSRT
jgi:prepilin-type N-terminal cleavage/methylation domain-containing protein